MLAHAIICAFICQIAGYNPFSDEDLYSINWVGPANENLQKLSDEQEIITVQTEEHEKYQCVLPMSQESIDASRKENYNGPSPEELMGALFSQSSCSYRIESYWTYELCHGRYIKQYHENKELGLQKPRMQEFYLGRLQKQKSQKEEEEAKKNKEEETDIDQTPVEDADSKDPESKDEEETYEPEKQEILSVKLDGLELPYFSVNMTGGTVCDLTGQPRASHIKYICQPNGRGEIYLLKETSSCEYDIIVLTAALCTHPMFKPKDPPVGKIECHAVGGSPRWPKQLSNLERDVGIQLDTEDSEEFITPVIPTPPKQTTAKEIPTRHTPTRPGEEPYPHKTNIGIATDKQLLREFLNGDYCLHGGGGWWKHEFCYNKYAKQYHEEGGETTSIYLGYWDKEAHLDWLNKFPAKRPKTHQTPRRQLSLYYSGGDVCDLTGTSRFVEVKLKCLNKPDQPHAVSIYLVEPKPCEYILGVESPIFCDLLEKADENGLLDHVKV